MILLRLRFFSISNVLEPLEDGIDTDRYEPGSIAHCCLFKFYLAEHKQQCFIS